jgi:hypothetical protein
MTLLNLIIFSNQLTFIFAGKADQKQKVKRGNTAAVKRAMSQISHTTHFSVPRRAFVPKVSTRTKNVNNNQP